MQIKERNRRKEHICLLFVIGEMTLKDRALDPRRIGPSTRRYLAPSQTLQVGPITLADYARVSPRSPISTSFRLAWFPCDQIRMGSITVNCSCSNANRPRVHFLEQFSQKPPPFFSSFYFWPQAPAG